MKLPCAVIQDLLPLYAEDLASDVSRTLVEEHLPACEDCRRQLEELKAPMPAAAPAIPLLQVKSMLTKNLWLTVVLTVCMMLSFFIPFFYCMTQPYNMTYYEGLVTIEEKEDGSLALTFAEPYWWFSASGIQDNARNIDARGLQVGSIPRIYRLLRTNIGSREAHISADFGAPDLIFFVNPNGETIHLWGDIPDGYVLEDSTLEFEMNDYLLRALILFVVFRILWAVFHKRKIGIVFGHISLFFLCFSLGHLLVTGDFSTKYLFFNKHFYKLTFPILSTTAALFASGCSAHALYRLRKVK